MQKKSVYIIGNILMDVLADVDDKDISALSLDKGIMKLVNQEERKKILDYISNRELVYKCGGAAPNTAITLSALGTASALSGRVGNDELGNTYIRRLEEHGVSSHVSKKDGNTGTCIVLITPDSERTMNTDLAVNREYTISDINPDVIAKSDYFYFTGYMWDTENQKSALLEAIKIAEDNNTKIAFDLADPFAVKRSKDDFIKLIEEHCSIVFANREEIRILFDNPDIQSSIDRISKMCGIAVIKDGKNGSYVSSKNSSVHIPVNKVNAVDSTGAGDTYAAGFLHGLCIGLDLEHCGHLASWLASRIVQIKGAQFTPNEIDEINKLIQNRIWDPFD